MPLPGAGALSGVSVYRRTPTAFFTFSSFTDPGTVFQLNGAKPTEAPTVYRKTEARECWRDGVGLGRRPREAAAAVPPGPTHPAPGLTHTSLRPTFLQVKGYDPEDFVTTQEWATSADGTRVPLFVTRAVDSPADGARPTLLYGYGGFNVALTPSFSVSRCMWMAKFGAVYASANLRGGGEFGTAWRDAGSGRHKQAVFDDFQAAAKHLVALNWTNPGRLAIQGGSNGGTLVGACANQAPGLYAAVIDQVGVADMARFSKFTIGHAWVSDFGDPEDPEDWASMAAWSPLHNVVPPPLGTRNYPGKE